MGAGSPLLTLPARPENPGRQRPVSALLCWVTLLPTVVAGSFELALRLCCLHVGQLHSAFFVLKLGSPCPLPSMIDLGAA